MFWIADMRRSLNAGRVTGVLALLVFGTALAGCINTATYGTGESPEVTVIKGATGGLTGLGRKKEEIEYRPRAPLVMPPENNLRPPVVASASADPDWPVEAGAPGTEVADPLGSTSRDNKAYRDGLKPFVGNLPVDERPASYDKEKDIARAHVDSVRDREARNKFKSALADVDGLNSGDGRRYLTDPPETYRQPADTAQKEFEDIEEAQGMGFAKLFNWIKRPN